MIYALDECINASNQRQMNKKITCVAFSENKQLRDAQMFSWWFTIELCFVFVNVLTSTRDGRVERSLSKRARTHIAN